MAIKKGNRPFSVTVLIAIVLTFTASQFLRVWVAFRNFAFYSSLPLKVHPLFIIASGLFWGMLALWLARGLWRRATWAPNGAKFGLVAFFAFGWLVRLFLQAPGPQQTDWPFEIIANMVIIAGVFLVFALPSVQAFFGGQHERQLKDR